MALSVGLADSINPSTVGPALYLATAPRGLRRVAQFTAAVFAVDLLAGLVLTIGPGRALLGLVPHPQGTVRHVIELVAGVVVLGAAVAVWIGRGRLAHRALPGQSDKGGSAWATGATVAAVELPTAAPYFAVIAAITASTASLPEEIGLVTLYNIAFVLPLVAIVVVLAVAGDHADPWLARGGEWLQRRWPVVLAALLLFVGSVLAILGGSGLVRQ